MGARLLLEGLQEFARGRDDTPGPEDRLDHDSSETIGVLADGRAGTLDVVVVEHDGVVRRVDG